MNILSIIPARGGSKGIKKKNLKLLNGKSLIARSIEHSLHSQLVTRTIVSSDNYEIIEEALKYGAEVPFIRPKELAKDHVLDLPVFEHALNFLEKEENYIPDVIVHLRPTSPYRKAIWIDQAIELLLNNSNADSVRSVSEPEKHPYRMFTINPKGFLTSIMQHEHPTPYLLRRQDLPKIYFYNCVIDITTPNTIKNKKSMTGDNILPFILDPEEVIDIDTPKDFEIAEFILKDKL